MKRNAVQAVEAVPIPPAHSPSFFAVQTSLGVPANDTWSWADKTHRAVPVGEEHAALEELYIPIKVVVLQQSYAGEEITVGRVIQLCQKRRLAERKKLPFE